MKNTNSTLKSWVLTGLCTLSLFSFLILQSGCSSSDSKEGGDEVASNDGLEGGDLGDSAGGDAAAADKAAPAKGGEDDIVADLGDDPSKDTELPDSALDEKPQDQAQAAPPAETPPTDAPPADATVAQNDTPPPAEAPAETPAPAVEPTPDAAPVAAAAPPSLKKIKDAPYTSHGRTMNTVYVARDGDTVDSVSTKIFGSADHKKELVQDNPVLKRGVKVGDKIYFNSPRRPDDTTTMLTYYEDKGIPPQIYTTKAGDNIKSFSSDLLGFKNAWKEVWATNSNVESKDVVPEGLEIRYWGNDTAAAAAPEEKSQEVAANVPPPAPVQDTLPPPPPAPPPQEVLPPPPPALPPVAMAQVEPPMKKPAAAKEQDQTMALGVAGILVLAAVMLFGMIIKRGRAKKMRLGQTQV